jgi:hypothetical protein
VCKHEGWEDNHARAIITLLPSYPFSLHIMHANNERGVFANDVV